MPRTMSTPAAYDTDGGVMVVRPQGDNTSYSVGNNDDVVRPNARTQAEVDADAPVAAPATAAGHDEEVVYPDAAANVEADMDARVRSAENGAGNDDQVLRPYGNGAVNSGS